MNEEGTYKSEGTGLNFTYDHVRDCFIPNHVPDDELFELAHIEGDFLVGDVTGTRYRIGDDGNILTPKEIEFLLKSGHTVK